MALLWLLVFLASFVGWCFLLTRLARCPIEVTPLLAGSSIILVLYAGALAGALAPTAKAVAAGGIAALAYSIVMARRHGDAPDVFCPGFVLFAVGAILLWLKVRSTSFHAWDEFSHWGYFPRELSATNRLPDADSQLILKNYPPGSGLFQYLVGLLMGMTEGHTIFAQDFLLLCGVTTLFQGARWKQWRALAALLICATLLIFMLGPGLRVSTMDHLLGVYFGAGIAVYLLDRATPQRPLLALPVCCVLPLLKAVGLLMAALIALFILIDQIVQAASRSPAAPDADPGVSWGRRAFVWAGIVVVFALPIAVDQSWQVHLRHYHWDSLYTVNQLSMGQVVRGLVAGAGPSPRETTIITNFKGALATLGVGAPSIASIVMHDFTGLVRDPQHYAPAPNVSPPSLLIWVLVYLAAVAVAARVQPTARHRVRVLVASAVILAGGVIYHVGLLSLYINWFSEYEGVRLASYNRYLATYLLGAAIAVLSFLALALRDGPEPNDGSNALPAQALTVAAILCVFSAPLSSAAFFLRRTPDMIPARAVVHKVLEPLVGRIDPGKKVFFVWQGSSGFELTVARYELLPIRMQNPCWSVGKKYKEGDIWTCDITVEELAKRMSECDLVLVGNTDSQFWDRYGSLFEDPEEARHHLLFAVVKSGAPGIRLKVQPY
jgi:hypothetical protein